MKCGFCNIEFDEKSAIKACSSCPMAGNCSQIRCPRCGYENPKLPSFSFRSKREKDKKQICPDDNPASSPGLSSGNIAETEQKSSEKKKKPHEGSFRFISYLSYKIHVLLSHSNIFKKGSEHQMKNHNAVNGFNHSNGICTLGNLPIGEQSVVVRLKGNRSSNLKLSALGLLPGAGIVVEQRNPALVFRMGHSRFAVDQELASSIEVSCA